MTTELGRQLIKALGCPPNCRKLTLTIEAREVPRIEYEILLVDEFERDIAAGIQVDDVRRLQFMVRLEPFEP